MNISRLVCAVGFLLGPLLHLTACSDMPAAEPVSTSHGNDTQAFFEHVDAGLPLSDGSTIDGDGDVGASLLPSDAGAKTNDLGPVEEDTGAPSNDCEYGDKKDCVTACGTPGTQTCVKNWGECVGPDELCNGLDDDCDGEVDEDFEGLGEACDGADTDMCMNGIVTCSASGIDSYCDEGPEGIEEVCNDIDDDCNGIVDDVADPSECIEVPGEVDCENVMNESGYCLTFYGTQLAYLGLDTGQVCPFVETGSYGTDSIAWLGTSVYHCGLGTNSLMRVDALTGEIEEMNVKCTAATAYKDGLLLMPYIGTPEWKDTLMFYPNESDIQTATFQTIAPVDYYATRMTTQGDTLYTTWHSTHEVDKFSLPGGQTVNTVFPQSYDDWIWGISVTDDMRMVITNSWAVWIFDATTGAFKQKHQTMDLKGLACVTPD